MVMYFLLLPKTRVDMDVEMKQLFPSYEIGPVVSTYPYFLVLYQRYLTWIVTPALKQDKLTSESVDFQQCYRGHAIILIVQ